MSCTKAFYLFLKRFTNNITILNSRTTTPKIVYMNVVHIPKARPLFIMGRSGEVTDSRTPQVMKISKCNTICMALTYVKTQV